MKAKKYRYIKRTAFQWKGKEYDANTPAKDVERLLKECPLARLFYFKEKGETK